MQSKEKLLELWERVMWCNQIDWYFTGGGVSSVMENSQSRLVSFVLLRCRVSLVDSRNSDSFGHFKSSKIFVILSGVVLHSFLTKRAAIRLGYNSSNINIPV